MTIRDCLNQNGGLQVDGPTRGTYPPPESAADNALAVSEAEGTASQGKRRYRFGRYRKDLRFLRPVTSSILQELDKRVPSDAGKTREIICFAIERSRGDTEPLVVVTFGYDGSCRVVNLSYPPGDYDVEQVTHNIDLHRLQRLIARRRQKWRNQAGNNLAAQLLIRFIVDINNKLARETGPYLQFGNAWPITCQRLTLEPKSHLKKILKRRLADIMHTDPDLPSDRTYTVSVRFDSGYGLADYDELRRRLLEGGGEYETCGGVFTADEELLTERFVALAWLAFHELANENPGTAFVKRTMEFSDMIGSPNDTDRLCGWTGDVVWWQITCRVPSAKNRKRSIGRLQKWIKRSLKSRLNSAVLALDWSISEDKRREMRHQKLLSWAEQRWGASKVELVVALEERLEGDNGDYTLLCEEQVSEYRRFDELARAFSGLPSTRTPSPDTSLLNNLSAARRN